MGLPADLGPYGHNGLPSEGTVPCPLLGMAGTSVGPQLFVQRWQGLSHEEGSVLAGTFGGLVGLCWGLGLAVTGVCAGFRDSGMSVPGHSRVCAGVTGSGDTQVPMLAVVRVCAGGADLELMGSVLDLGTSGSSRVCMGPILAGSLFQGTLFPPGRVTLGHSCFSQGMASLLWDEWGYIWSAHPIPQPQLCPFPAPACGHLLTSEQHLPLAPSPGMTLWHSSGSCHQPPPSQPS